MNAHDVLSFFRSNHHVQAAIAVLLAFAAAMLARWIVTRLISPLMRRTKINVDDRIVEMLRQPVFNTVLLAGLGGALAIARFPATLAFIGAALIKSLVILIWLAFALSAARLVLTWMTNQKRQYKAVQPVTLPLFEITMKLVLFGVALYFILVSWKVDVTAWMASAGIIGIAVGFAAKDTLSNLFAGVSILADTPYKLGDMIVLDSGERGRVTHIGLRSTRIETSDEVLVTIPNSIIANVRIKNENRPLDRERVRISIELSYGINADEVKQVLVKAARSTDHVLDDPEPRARLARVTDRVLTFNILCWIDDPMLRGQVHDAINSAAYSALLQAGIDAPPTKHELLVHELPRELADAVGDLRSSLARDKSHS